MKYADKIIETPQDIRCLECGTDLRYGRRGRKFCSDKCKNAFHNRESHRARAVHLKIISTLNKNYEVLTRLTRMGMPTVEVDDLIKMGFNPTVFTGHRVVRGHNQYSCFEFDYYLSPNKLSRIERHLF